MDQKETLGLLNQRQKKRINFKIESNGAIIVFFNSSERKGGNLIIYPSGSDRFYFSLSSMEGRGQFYCRAVCNAQKIMPVRLFNSIFFFLLFFIFLSFLFVSSREIENCYIIRVMIHQPASSFYEAQTGEFILEAEELLKLRETLTRVYVQRTGKPLWVVSEDMERDVFMSATEAQAYGIVDLVAVE